MNHVTRMWRGSFTRRWHQNFELCDTVDYVSGHQARVALLMLALKPDVSGDAITAALIHDQGEVGSGDMSYMCKKEHPILGEVLAVLEREERVKQHLPSVEMDLDEYRLLQFCDRLDSWLWMMRHKRELYARRDWQEMLSAMRETAEALDLTEKLEAIIDDEVAPA